MVPLVPGSPAAEKVAGLLDPAIVADAVRIHRQGRTDGIDLGLGHGCHLLQGGDAVTRQDAGDDRTDALDQGDIRWRRGRRGAECGLQAGDLGLQRGHRRRYGRFAAVVDGPAPGEAGISLAFTGEQLPELPDLGVAGPGSGVLEFVQSLLGRGQRLGGGLRLPLRCRQSLPGCGQAGVQALELGSDRIQIPTGLRQFRLEVGDAMVALLDLAVEPFHGGDALVEAGDLGVARRRQGDEALLQLANLRLTGSERRPSRGGGFGDPGIGCGGESAPGGIVRPAALLEFPLQPGDGVGRLTGDGATPGIRRQPTTPVACRGEGDLERRNAFAEGGDLAEPGVVAPGGGRAQVDELRPGLSQGPRRGSGFGLQFGDPGLGGAAGAVDVIPVGFGAAQCIPEFVGGGLGRCSGALDVGDAALEDVGPVGDAAGASDGGSSRPARLSFANPGRGAALFRVDRRRHGGGDRALGGGGACHQPTGAAPGAAEDHEQCQEQEASGGAGGDGRGIHGWECTEAIGHAPPVAGSLRRMRIRTATRDDLIGLGRVADAAFWETYAGLLKPDTIGRFLSSEYSPSVLRRRVLRGGVLVAEGGGVVGFVDAVAEHDALEVSAIAVEPRVRHRGIGRALLGEVRRRHPALPLSADVLLGNLAAERLFEGSGFVPGEIVPSELFDEDVVERRWWSEPEATPGATTLAR